MQDLRQAQMPLSAENAISAAVAADTGLAVIACCEAIVATAIGRSGRMPLLMRRLVDHRQQRVEDVPGAREEREHVRDRAVRRSSRASGSRG